MADIYNNFEELKKNNTNWVDYFIEYDISSENNILIMAIHWWEIEPSTTQIAKKISKDNDFSFYSFLWKFGLHITSTNFDEPKALELAEKHKLIITIHGCRWDEDFIYVWWRNSEIREALIKEFLDNWFNSPSFEDIPIPLKWQHINNICNKWKLKEWIQIEISKNLRNKLAEDEELLNKFSFVIKKTLKNFKI